MQTKYPIAKANLGGVDFKSQIKSAMQDLWCIYIGQLTGDIDDDYVSGDFFDLSGAGKNFKYISVRPIYSFEDANYIFAFPSDANAEFRSISKFFPGNPLNYLYKDTNGIQTTDMDGIPLKHPYGIRVFGYNGGNTNIATLLFKSKSEWESWWNNMKDPQKNGTCKY